MDLYKPDKVYDELITKAGRSRKGATRLVRWLKREDPESIGKYSKMASLAVREMGISYAIYSDGENIDRQWPFDLIPRIISAKEWGYLSSGLLQRSRAINRFLNDIYNEQSILSAGLIPKQLILGSPNYLLECKGVSPRHGIWAHISGTDLIRDEKGKFYALEDNLRVPSGVSYMIENREVTKRLLPDLFANYSISPVDDYPARLYEMVKALAPSNIRKPRIVLLTPGIYNSAYFEHAYLSQRMGIELVEGSDLFIDSENNVNMRTVQGNERVDVIYRRINDEFLDPEELDPESQLGCKGLMEAWRLGKVAIANAPGAGVADDKAVYAFVPTMIRYYLKEEPLIKNIKTYLCMHKPARDFVLQNLERLVVKPINQSGGYGILIGPHSSDSQRRYFKGLITKNPENYIAQPTLSLSTAPTIIEQDIEPRHIDLRPFTLYGKEGWVTSGGLTRVALKKGSLVVNSSQGGGSKDTWIVEETV